MDKEYTRKCKHCLEYFDTDDLFEDFCSRLCQTDWDYAYEDEWDNNFVSDEENGGYF